MTGNPDKGPVPGLRWPAVLGVASVFGLVAWVVGSGTQTTGDPEQAAPATSAATSTTSPDSSESPPTGTVVEFGVVGDWDPNPFPAGPLRRRADLNRVRRVAAAPDGTLWLATDGGVINWNPATDAVVVFGSGDELPTNGANGVVVGADGTVWAGSPGWIAVWNGAWTRFAAPAGFERPLAVGPDGAVWWGSSDGGVIGRFNGAEWEILEDLVSPGSESIAVAPDGTVWVATTPGANAHDGVAEYGGYGWLRHGLGDGLPAPIGGSVTVTPDGSVWAGSTGSATDRGPGGGVARHDGSSWSVYTIADGLASDNSAVAAGPDGAVWAVAPEGLSRFDGSEWTAFPDTAGFGFGAVVDRDGMLWAPSTSLEGGLRGFDGGSMLFIPVGKPEVIGADVDDQRLPPGSQPHLPDSPRLDFLATRCDGRGADVCDRVGHFLDPADATRGTAAWAAGLPFHISQGFVNPGDDLLGEDFEIIVSMTRRAGPELEDGAFVLDRTYRFRSDYTVRGLASRCGPGYWRQADPQPCEWLVHDFPVGLPPGLYDIWVEWQAPCDEWLGLGLTEVCDDPNEVAVLFASSTSMPFYGPGYWDGAAGPFDPYIYPVPITKGASPW